MTLAAHRIALTDITPELRYQWMGLLDTCGGDLSLAPEWFASTVNARQMAARASVFVVVDSDRIVGLLPHVDCRDRVGGLPVSAAESPGSCLVAYHPEIVAAETARAAVLDAIIRECSRRCDVLVLPNLPAYGGSAAAALECARSHGLIAASRAGHTSPYLAITTSWEQFVAAKDKKFRYKVRNSFKELEAAGTVTEDWLDGPQCVERLYTQMLQIEARSWKVECGMAISGSQLEQRYYQQLLPFLAERNALRANVLYLDGKPIAYSLCYVSHGAFRQLKTSFDDGHAKLSPGSAVLQRSVQRAFEAGAPEFDFLGDAMPHKNQWSTHLREHQTFYLFLRTWRGRLAGHLRQIMDRIRTSELASRDGASAAQDSSAQAARNRVGTVASK